MPAAARWGFSLALVLGALALLASLINPLALPSFIMLLVAAAGLWRGWAWCGYGPALWLVAQSIVSIFLAPQNSWKTLAIAMPISWLLAWVFFRTGRSLDTGRAQTVGAALWIAVVAVKLLLGVLIQIFVNPTGSMEDTLLIGDQIAVQRIGFSQPTRGELIVLRYPVDTTMNFIKRVIGLPGDRIHIVNKRVYLNGVPLDEPYASHKTDYVDSFRDNLPSNPNIGLAPQGLEMLRDHVVNGEVVVPPDAYFVMGDGRDNSLDSRYWGFVPKANVAGIPRFIIWSEDQTKSSLVWWPKTRWDRTFRPVR